MTAPAPAPQQIILQNLTPEKQALLANQILVNNLAHFLGRYPQQEESIFKAVLRDLKNVPKPKLEGFKLCLPNSDYIPRFCFIICIPEPSFWDGLKPLWNSTEYFVIEPNPDAVAWLFQTVNLLPWLSAKNFHFFLNLPGEEVIAPLQRVLRQTPFAGKLYLGQTVSPNDDEEGVDKKWIAYGREFQHVIKNIVDHVYFNFGNINDSIAGLDATLQNMDRISQAGGIEELKDLHKGKPVAVIGAGASLDPDLPILAEHQDKFIIVATDATVMPLLAHKIRVDYVCSIERYNGFQEAFFRGLPPMDADLVVYPVVHKDVLDCYPGPVRFSYRNYAWYAYFEKNWPMGVLESGGSAGHLAARLGLHLGASKLYLIGCDLVYEQNPDGTASWRSHCRGTAYAKDWDRYYTEEEIRAKPEFYGFYDVEGNDGKRYKTHAVYHQWAKEHGAMALNYGVEGQVISTSPSGIKTPRIAFKPLSEVVKELTPIDTSRKSPMNRRAMSKEGHGELLEQLKGIHATVLNCLVGLKALGDAWDSAQVKDAETFQMIRDCLYVKFAFDTLFTGFALQNCAMEFFRNENVFHAIPDGPVDNADYPRRIIALFRLYATFEEVLRKTIQTFKKVEGVK